MSSIVDEAAIETVVANLIGETFGLGEGGLTDAG